MKFLRFRHEGRAQWGILQDGVVHEVLGSVYTAPRVGVPVAPPEHLELLPPCEPTTIVALAYNYKDLVGPREMYEEPLIFLKSTGSVTGPTAPIVILPEMDVVWVEVEVAFVVRLGGRHIDSDRAAEHILGYTIANDVTARNVYGRDHHLGRSKAIDTFCPVGSVLHADIDTSDLELSTTINGRRTQHGNTRDRILDDAATLALVSRYVSLAPGDLVLTGTPAGAMDSVVRPGDEAVLNIPGLGTLTNPITLGGDKR